MTKLQDLVQGKNNHLSFMRLMAALLVIFSHSWPISGNGEDPLYRISGEQLSFGNLAVVVFFFFGGFFIMKSVENKDAKTYFRARLSRIFPSLWIVVLLSVFVLGPLVTECSVSGYFGNLKTWIYLLNGLVIPIHELPGVFLHNPYDASVNGPLYTLTIEVLCYIFCYFFYRLGLSSRKKAIWTVPAAAAAVIAAHLVPEGKHLVLDLFRSTIRLPAFFYLGMLCYIYRDKIPVSFPLFLVSVGVLIAGILLHMADAVVFIALPYIFLWLCFATGKKLAELNRFEISYGIYLTGWPVQQLLIRSFPGLMPVQLFGLASLIAIIAGGLITLADRPFGQLLFGPGKKADAKGQNGRERNG